MFGYMVNVGEEVGNALQTSIIRIAKGLLFDSEPERDTSKYEFIVFSITEDKIDVLAQLAETLPPMKFHVHKGNGSFLAAWNFVDGSEDNGVMFMSFFTGYNQMIFFGKSIREMILRKNSELLDEDRPNRF